MVVAYQEHSWFCSKCGAAWDSEAEAEACCKEDAEACCEEIEEEDNE